MASGFETFSLGEALQTAEQIKSLRRQSAFDTLREQAMRGQISAQDQAIKINAAQEDRAATQYTAEQRLLGTRTAVAAATAVEADPRPETIELWKPELDKAGVKVGDYSQATPEQIKAYATQIKTQYGGYLDAITKQNPKFAELDQAHKLQLEEIAAQHKNRLAEIGVTGAEARKTALVRPGTSFRALTPAEVKQAGLPAGTSAQIDETTGKVDMLTKPAAGGGLPVGALKIVDDAKQAMGASSSSKKLIDDATTLLSSGKINLGLINNAVARGRNIMGASSPESRGYASIRQSLEKLRNNYLLLAKGVQTEGDATRAWNSEVGESAQNDNKLALQQLRKADEMTGRMLQMQQDRIDTVYANYGATPPGEGDMQPAAPTQSSAAPQNSGPVRVTSPEEAMKLPSGTSFVTPDGRVKVRP